MKDTRLLILAHAAAGLLAACAHSPRQSSDANAGSVPMGPPVVDITKPAPAPGVATKDSVEDSKK